MSLRITYGWRRALGTCVCSVGAIAGPAAATAAQQVPIDTTAVPMATSDSLSVVRVCAGGDVTLGTNLDTTWTRRAAGARGVARVRALPPPAS
ncbi:MAG TPA: hypothetical protein VMM77_04965, partial [Gemmatimonadaceae bacterium]|nr:hypothetical protein [Gemmatimonadaceae bacterium]